MGDDYVRKPDEVYSNEDFDREMVRLLRTAKYPYFKDWFVISEEDRKRSDAAFKALSYVFQIAFNEGRSLINYMSRDDIEANAVVYARFSKTVLPLYKLITDLRERPGRIEFPDREKFDAGCMYVLGILENGNIDDCKLPKPAYRKPKPEYDEQGNRKEEAMVLSRYKYDGPKNESVFFQLVRQNARLPGSAPV